MKPFYPSPFASFANGRSRRGERRNQHLSDGPRSGNHIRGFEPVGGGRRERMLESGDLKLLALYLLNQQPAHGYDIIKSVGDLVGGDYSPSPGTVYPTLSLLEDMGYAAVQTQAGGRKQYSITPEGQAHAQEQSAAIQQVLSKLAQLRERSAARRVPDLQRAMENLKTSLRMGFANGEADAERVRKAADIIDRAAAEISRL